jgi:hypothetical protein
MRKIFSALKTLLASRVFSFSCDNPEKFHEKGQIPL